MKFVGASGRTYEVVSPSRGGGQADVFPATDEQGRKVAIKQARRPMPESEWLERERRHLSELHEQNPDLADVVIQLLDHGVSEGTPFLVLPWYDHNLRQWLDRERRPLARRLKALSLAARAVSRLHWADQDPRVGVVHRDIKPENFLLNDTPEGLQLVLADFGSARRGHLGQPSTLSGAAAYTAAFTAPEQTLPRRVQPDRSWDVFALGVTVYRVLVDHFPESVVEAAPPWTRSGQRLANLENRLQDRRRLSSDDAAELERLKGAPLEELVDVAGRPALTDGDRERIVEVFAEELKGSHLEAEADGLAQGLILALEHALRPDPRERQSDARPLALAVEAAHKVASRPPPTTFSWLHLSGLNAGAPDFETRWPALEEAWHEDLARLHALMGPWDAVFVTGDLTWSGRVADRAAAERTLRRVRVHLDALGSRPTVFAVPGERDLERPNNTLAAVVEVLHDWESKPHIQRLFWEDAQCEYRQAVSKANTGFNSWWIDLGLHRPARLLQGTLPGDFAATLSKLDLAGKVDVGVIGLNSAALSLKPDSPPQGLILSTHQLHGACQGNGVKWTRGHKLNLLLTAHGPASLSPAARAELDGEIAPPGRFGVHLCGGSGEARSTALGGASPRLTWAAPPLFPPQESSAAPGYLAGKATFGDRGVSLRLWPRTASRKAAGHLAFGPDTGRYSLSEQDQGTEPQMLKAPQKASRGAMSLAKAQAAAVVPAAPAPPAPPTSVPSVPAAPLPAASEVPWTVAGPVEVERPERDVRGFRWAMALGAGALALGYFTLALLGYGRPPAAEQTPPTGVAQEPSTPALAPTAGPTGRTHTTSALAGAPMTFIELSGGTFVMGRPDDEEGRTNELPPHQVKVSPFFIGQSEVTQAQWAVAVKAGQTSDCGDAKSSTVKSLIFEISASPVEGVSWCDAAHFANLLSCLEGRKKAYLLGASCEEGGVVPLSADGTGYRLPTEAEWEFAARAGTTTVYATGDAEVALARVGWYDKNSGGHPHEVCTAERPWGLCDLHGNVREWVWDWYGPYMKPSADGPADNPMGAAWVAAGPNTRVVRGGSFLSDASAARAAYRSAGIPNIRYSSQGFRLVLPSPSPVQQPPRYAR